ncbi:MAG: DUF2911 domain-containing protein [Gemmatimonadales bacterium]|nr:DUF2911 domain-containing protein [Gemmatimonadales bacterium]
MLAAHDLKAQQVAPDRTAHGFLIRLGSDTVGIERVTHSRTGFVAEVVERAPRVVSSRYEVQWGPDGRLSRYEVVQRVANPAGRLPLRTLVQRVGAGDQYRLETFRGDSMVVRVDTTVAGELVPWLLYGPSAAEFAFRRLMAAGADSLSVASISASAPRLGRLVVRRLGTNAFAFPFFLGQRFHAVMDTQGRMTQYSGRETTIKIETERLAAVPALDSIRSAWVALEASRGIVTDLSRRDTVTVTKGKAAITIDYGRPVARGRDIMGGVVPFDEVWRTGANAATHLRTTAPMLLGGKRLEAGTYTLWTLPTRTGVTLLVNSQVNVWGTSYVAAKDVIRVPMHVIPHEGSPVDVMTITLGPNDATGGVLLGIRWGTLNWMVELECLVEGNPSARIGC